VSQRGPLSSHTVPARWYLCRLRLNHNLTRYQSNPRSASKSIPKPWSTERPADFHSGPDAECGSRRCLATFRRMPRPSRGVALLISRTAWNGPTGGRAPGSPGGRAIGRRGRRGAHGAWLGQRSQVCLPSSERWESMRTLSHGLVASGWREVLSGLGYQLERLPKRGYPRRSFLGGQGPLRRDARAPVHTAHRALGVGTSDWCCSRSSIADVVQEPFRYSLQHVPP
jgi:hypothetical protein